MKLDMLGCRLCGSTKTSEVFHFDNHYIVHHLKASQDAENGFRSIFKLRECSSCGFLYSPDYFAPKDYLYDNYITLSSQKKQVHALSIIENIKSFCVTSDPAILEIGCNDGSFLSLLQEEGLTKLSAIEPARDAHAEAIKVLPDTVNDFFGTRNVDKLLSTASGFDVIVTRQVLEHISDLDDFLAGITACMRADGLLVIEVPDHTMNYFYGDYSFWEEHINYFTINTLRYLLSKHGLEIVKSDTYLFSGQALVVYCRPNKNAANVAIHDSDLELRRRYISCFSGYRDAFKSYLDQKLSEYGSIYIFGAGCRGLCLSSFLDLNDYISGFIDDSKEKVNKFVQGSNKPIHSFEDVSRDAFYLLSVNAESEQSVIASKELSSDRYCSILPPSKLLPEFWKKLFPCS